ncbi:MAG: sulfite exporter TauE/SafE family protein [Alphaproteobacteria bacterium]|nr:sulfite exporter TauE/SafE family protein [Alphaproteobacteria bacterium]
MSLAVAVAFAALAGTPHCLGMCGSLAVAGSSEGGWLPYQSGRVAVYATLGALAGAFGSAIPGPGWVPTAVSAILLVGFAAALAGLVPEPRVAIPGLARAGALFARQRGPLARFGFGIVNGLLPCGLLYATLAVPVSSGSATSGAALMVLFGLITAVPLTAAALGLRALLNGRRTRLLMAGVVLITGLSSLANRGGWLSEEPPACHHSP